MNIFVKSLFYLIVFSALHFGYDLTGWAIVTPFCGVDESIFQHLKMGFWAYLITSIIEFFAVNKRLGDRKTFWYPRFLSTTIIPWIIFLIWYIVPATFGKLGSASLEVLWAIFSTYISAVFATVIEKTIEQMQVSNPAKVVILILLIVSAFLYIKFTYTLPWIDMFVNPEVL